MFRDRYEREVDYLWQRLRQLSVRVPRLAALYTRNADARVTSLVQSAAVAFAAVHARIHDDGQALVRPLVAAAMPEALRPRPSSTILKLARSPDPQARFLGQVGSVQVPFELIWRAQVESLDLSAARIEHVHAGLQVLRVTLSSRPNAPLGSVLPSSLRFFVGLESCGQSLDLVRALRTSAAPIEVIGLDEKGAQVLERRLPPTALRWTRVDSPEPALVKAPLDRFTSSTELRDLYAFPESFAFFDLDVTALQGSKMTRAEITLPLGRVLSGLTVSIENVHLGCAPATNAFRAPIEPLRPAPGQVHWPVRVIGRPFAEVLHVSTLNWLATNDAHSRNPILSWDAPARPHRYTADETYFQLEQSIAIADPRTEMHVSFATAQGQGRPLPGVSVEGEVIASDGALTARLGLGDVGRGQGAENITRVSPSRRANLGNNHAWRMNAYARMPPSRFVATSHLAEFFALHDSSDVRDEKARVTVPRFGSATHAREHRLADGMLEWGDRFAVEMIAPHASDGEAWLLGELLSRAIAERTERLRYSRLALSRDGAPLASFDPRQGVRFPYPIG